MRPVTTPVRTVQPAREGGAATSADDAWAERSGRLYTDLERPARAMVRRAFRGSFSDDELDDIYASAWVGTLRALRDRHGELTDEEIRKYLLTAVANQASKELRRRRRKPTAPMERLELVPDDGSAPDERAVGAERTRVARDLLTSLPPRRRAVMLLRYGWGLDPKQVCQLVEGLSPRAYRKEVTRGVDQLTERMRLVERGEWCSDREPVLKAYVAGLADAEQRRQAEAHLSHCHQCTDFVGRLGGHLHDLGAGLTVPGALDAVDGELSMIDRIAEAGERTREALGGVVARGGGDATPEAVGQLTAVGGSRGTLGAASAGLLAKLTGIGTAGKVAVVCLSGGAAATACLSAGIVPGVGPGGAGSEAAVERERPAPRQARERTAAPEEAIAAPVPDPVEEAPPRSEPPAPDPEPPGEDEPAPEVQEPIDPVAPTAPPVDQEAGVAAAASAAGPSTGPSGGGDGNRSAVSREFGGP